MKLIIIILVLTVVAVIIGVMVYTLGYIAGAYKGAMPKWIGRFWAVGQPCEESGCDVRAVGVFNGEHYCRLHMDIHYAETPEGREKLRRNIRRMLDE